MAKCDLVGQRFGHLEVLNKTEFRDKCYVIWECRCTCGEIVRMNTKRLQRNKHLECNCKKEKDTHRGPIAEDLTGRTFGSLTVLKRVANKDDRTCWLCRCGCGKEKEISARNLKAGKTKSCGCQQNGRGRTSIDISGQRFGRLIARYPTQNRDKKSSVYWNCLCDCGNESEVTIDRLLYGAYRSCGCLKKENQQKIFGKLHMVDGTCVEWLEKRKRRSDNTSGFRGVYKMKNGKYRVSIGFKRQRFHVGSFEVFEAAVNARMRAEELLHDGFVEAYYEWEKSARSDREWARGHPFVYEAEKRDNELVITRTRHLENNIYQQRG